MVTIDKIQNGVTKFIDSEILTQYPNDSIQRILIGTGMAIAIKKKANDLLNYASFLGLVNDNGEIDIDILKEELLNHIPESGFSYENKMIGKMIFTKDDINTLYKYIAE